MKMKLNNFIPEEQFAIHFVHWFSNKLKNTVSVESEGFTFKLRSFTDVHWMGDFASANDSEQKVAIKIMKQLLSYWDTDYVLAKRGKYDYIPAEFNIKKVK